MYTIGQQLRQARERLGINLEEMERRTRVHISYLQALENDQMDSLFNPVYVRAYIRAYAKEVGLPDQALIEQYEAMASQTNQTTMKKSMVNTHPHATNQSVAMPRPNNSSYQKEESRNKTKVIQSARKNSPQMQPNVSQIQSSQKTLSMNTIQMSSAHLNRKFAPRKVAMRAKEQEMSSLAGEKKKSSPWKWITVICALLLVGGGGAYFTWNGKSSGETNAAANPPIENPGIVGSSGPLLEPGEANDELGQMYYISNVNKLEVKFMGRNKSSKFKFGTSKDNAKEMVLKPGETFSVNTAGKSEIWFWFEIPSSFEVTINGQILDTSAQDLAKSYRVQIKK
ncbi:helix-turn-helix domain-containing protein [Thermoflavimicrobium daqui]|uniref:HTH cro/C1-type domain-containing protein n=1 Tax=Thermoflavimicrobium daqui TaxID=2137476 RepID=A0A364K7V7_9BACL|nr:helix-turn-helix domain-containing protein [Thermoflavimicrobium daqui]RAL26373.1 hypothetical protein DL897_05120 [Thermoflavimicrobium daqui]